MSGGDLDSAIASRERRIDPQDGEAYTFKELLVFYYGKYGRKAIQAYWETLAPGAPERRIDPEDGQAYTYEEIVAFYQSRHKKKAIDAYWGTLVLVKEAQASRSANKVKRAKTSKGKRAKVAVASSQVACIPVAMPVVTVSAMGGVILWGPLEVGSLTVAELYHEVERPARSPGMKLLHDESILEPDFKLSALPNACTLTAIFDPPVSFDHDFVQQLIEYGCWRGPGARWEKRPRKDWNLKDLWARHDSKTIFEGISYDPMGGSCSVPVELKTRLSILIDQLKAAEPAFYHPGSNGVVRDLVHPSLYPYIHGVSPIAPGISSEEIQELFRPPNNDDVDSWDEQGNAGGERLIDMWGREYEESTYQWLPSEVEVSQNGACRIEGYVNNLPREKYAELYQALECLLEKALPHLEQVWSYARSVRFFGTKRHKFARELHPYSVNGGFTEHYEKREIEPLSLRGRRLQVIVKIADYEVQPGQTHEGVWHVEGMSHENIVATAELVLRKDTALNGGNLSFKRAFQRDEAGMMFSSFPQCRPMGVDAIVQDGLLPLGQLGLPEGRLVAFPNSHVHRLQIISNTDANGSPVAVRRIVVFWLVNPDRRILSTAHVPPQQNSMPLEEAEKHMLALMEERKYSKQDWNVREIGLCEH